MTRDKMLAEWFWCDRWMGSSGFLLPMEARGVYREMLTQAWRRGGSLPADFAQVRRAIGASEEEWSRAWPLINGFWINNGETLVNQTQAGVYAEALAMRDRAQARAQAGAQAKHKKYPKHAPEKVLKVCPPSPSPTNGLPVPVREEPESVNAECAALSKALTEAVKRASEITGRPGIEILADAMVRGKGPPITNPGGCTEASRRLWRITVDRVNGFVAAWQSDRKGKARKSGGGGSWDRADASQADLDARAMAWIDSNWRDMDNFKHKTDLLRSLLAHKCPPDIEGAVTMILIARNPHLTKGEAA